MAWESILPTSKSEYGLVIRYKSAPGTGAVLLIAMGH